MRCPHCRNKLLQKSSSDDSTRLRIEGPVEFDKDGLCKSRCYWCKSEVTLPIDLRKADDEVPPKLVLGERKIPEPELVIGALPKRR